MKKISRSGIDHPDFDKGNGLVPVIIQDAGTMQVLMQAYMNHDAYEKTVQTGRVTFYSRSKQRLWTKGETSGNFLTVVDMWLDCDRDCLLIKVKAVGPACHTGETTCFFKKYDGQFQDHTNTASPNYPTNTANQKPNHPMEEQKTPSEKNIPLAEQLPFIAYLEELLRGRQQEDPEQSYTARLFASGSKRIAKKLGEEAVELALEAEHGDSDRFTEEAADLVYHLTVLLLSKGLGWQEVIAELKKRHKK